MSQPLSPAALQDPAVLQLPALSAPPGVIPNFTNPEDIGPRLIVSGAILLTFVIIALASRAYTKLCIIRKISLDDLTISLAAMCAIASYTLCVYEARLGVLGRHLYEIRIGEYSNINVGRANTILTLLYAPSLWLTKGTFCLLYLQLFRPLRWLRLNVYIGATVLTVFYWGFLVALIVFYRRRPGETWGELFLSSRSARSVKLNIPIALGGMIADVWLLILPLVAVYSLQLHKTRRVALNVMFSTGLMAVAASAASVYYRYVFRHSEDKTWIAIELNIVSLIEVDVGLITACMPSFAKMLHHHLPAWAILKPRLKSFVLACTGKGKSRSPTTVPQDSEQTYKTRSDIHLEERPHSHGLKSGEPDMESLGSVQHDIGGATLETFDDDRVLLEA